MVEKRDWKVRVGNSAWLFYSKGVVDKLSNYFFRDLVKPLKSVRMDKQPVHKELYMYSIAYEKDKFEAMLDFALESSRIGKDPSFDITSGDNGKLCLATNHPWRKLIERVLNADRSLSDSYRRIENYYARMSSILYGRVRQSCTFSIKVSNEGYVIRMR